MAIYDHYGLLRVYFDTRVYVLGTKQCYLLVENHVPIPVCDIARLFLGRIGSNVTTTPTSSESDAHAPVRSFCKRIEERKPTVVLTPLCRRQRRKDVSAETFSDRRGASRASRRRESRGNHDPARDRRDGRCGNARGREVRRCDAMR